ncbi:MAG: CIA30 family protein [Candidatus Zixiibacteriota bacterium]
MTPPSEHVLIDFRERSRDSNWMIINDGVMGGRSSSRMERSDSGHAVFSGIVSLENNGGFASTRASVTTPDEHEFTGVRLWVRGDGQQYRFRIRTDDLFDGVAYQKTFATIAGEWTTVDLPFSEYSPSFRGRIPTGVGSLDPNRIRQIGFLIADKQAGPFRLEIERIAVYR